MTLAFLQSLGPMEILIIPFFILWVWSFISVIRRNDFTGMTKAIWIVVIFFVPFACIVYLIYRLTTGKPIPDTKTFESN